MEEMKMNVKELKILSSVTDNIFDYLGGNINDFN